MTQGCPRTRRARGFTLVELLTVMFIILVLVAVLAPAVAHSWKMIFAQGVRSSIQAICKGLESYKGEFGMYPPSEPELGWNVPVDGDAAGLNRWKVGATSLFFHLNGRDGRGYRTEKGDKLFKPRVAKVKQYLSGVRCCPVHPDQTGGNCQICVDAATKTLHNRPPVYRGAFVDPWGDETDAGAILHAFEYFKAYPNRPDQYGRRDTAAAIYPRACLGSYAGLNGQTYVGCGPTQDNPDQRPIRIPAQKWLDPDYETWQYDPAHDWQHNSVPVEPARYLVVCPGQDGVFGTPDDVGNW